jgi:small neutral amino acid transporter SnatA (MarC family)
MEPKKPPTVSDHWRQLAQAVIAIIAAAAFAVLVVNFILTGRDVPAGLLSLIGGIFGAIFAVDAITKRTHAEAERRKEEDRDA